MREASPSPGSLAPEDISETIEVLHLRTFAAAVVPPSFFTRDTKRARILESGIRARYSNVYVWSRVDEERYLW